MSRLKQIDKYVEALYQSTLGSMRNDETRQAAQDLGQALSEYISDKDIDYICSSVFRPDTGIIAFLRKVGGNKDLSVSPAVKDVLEFIARFTEKRKKHPVFQLYAKDLKTECMFIAKSGSAASRGAAVQLLISLLDKKNKFDTSELDVPQIFKRFAEDYTLPKTKLPGGVKSKLIDLLGLIARYYPETVRSNDIKTLKRWGFDNMEHQMKLSLKDAESATITGSLRCFAHIMYREDSPETIKPQSSESDRLFNIIFAVLMRYRDTSRYDVPNSALILFKEHTDFFSNMFVEHWQELFHSLHFWATHHNIHTYKLGLQAYEQYLRQLATILYHNIGGRQEKAIFMNIMAIFNEELKTADNLENFYKVSISIRGLGYFAKVCHKLLKEEEVFALRNSLVKISDWFYSDTNSNQIEYMRHIPAFIKAYTLFAAELDPIPVELMEIIHRMCNTYIMGYMDISGYHRRNGVYNIYSLFCVLFKKGEGFFRNFLNDFFEKALICTCTQVQKLDAEERPAYNDLLYFWKAILNKPYDSQFTVKAENKNNNDNNENNDEDEEIEENFINLYRDPLVTEPANLLDTLYDAFLLAVLKLTKTFNLKLKNVAEEIETEEGEEASKLNTVTNTLRPVNQKDFILFQNLVDFWCLILKDLDNKRISEWVYIVGTAIIDQSVLNPLVSGFYRMMSEIMTACEKRQFFKGCKEYYSRSKSESKHGKLKVPEEYATFLVFREYLKEVWHRLQQFTDELLASCLRLILAYPIAFFDLAELVTPLEKALKLGIAYHPLATIAMNSLDNLLDPKLSYDINSDFLSRVLPCINEYLLVGVVNDLNEEAGGIKKKKYRPPTAAQRRYKSVHIKMTSDQLGVAKSEYSALPDLQLRMMQFLGRLGGKNKQLLLQGNDSIQTNDMLAWDSVKRLKLQIPFQNARVDIYLDEYLPRICELAESSPDRQVKVAACELLHGLTLFMIGNAATKARDSKTATESDFHKLYLHVFPVMLRLAIDPDQVARDMYRLLFSQIIHWLTNNMYSENPETIALLQTCLEAACNTDAGRRDYAAECIQEFVKWSIKQSSRSTDAATNISSLLKRLYNLMSNPSPTKRFGASLVFNRIYRLFREEASLVSKYTLEILGHLFVSLKMAEVDHPSIGTQDQIIEAISHIKRILRQKASVFLKEDPNRNLFMNIEGMDNLSSVVEWAFGEMGKNQRTYAKVCMNFFTEFVMLLPGVKTAKDWLTKKNTTNHNYYINVFETDQLKTPSAMDEEDKIMEIYTHWIKRLNTTLDGYIWLIERKVLDPVELLNNPDSMFLIAVAFFIKNTPYDVLEEKLDQSIIEKTKIISIYTHNAVRLIYFFDLVFKSPETGLQCYNYMTRVSADILHHHNFTSVIARTLLFPKQTSKDIQSHQGNAVTNSSVTRTYNVAKDYIVSVKEKSASQFMESLADAVSKIIHDEDASLLVKSKAGLERSSLIEIIQTIDGIKLLQSLGSLDLVCQQLHIMDDKHPETVEKYCLALFNQYLHFCQTTQDPLWIQLLGNSITISFSQPGFAEQHASELLGFSCSLEKLANSVKLDCYQKYREYIFECMTNNFGAFSQVLTSHIEHPLLRNYVSMFLEYLKQNRLNHRKLVFKFSDYLVDDPSLLDALVTHSKTDNQLLDLILSLKLLFGMDPSIMSRSKRKPVFDILWKAFMTLLDKSHPFTVKSNALDLLPVYISLDEEHTKLIINKLNESIVQEFPPETDGLEKGTTLYNEYVSYLDKLLETMSTFKSADIFNLLIGVFVQEEHHIHEEAINRNVEAFTNGLGQKKFMEVADYCFREFKNEHNNILQRHKLAQLIISLLIGVDDRAVEAFYVKNIVYIMSVIQEPLTSTSSKQLADWNLKTDCLRLFQALFDRLPEENLQEDGAINDVWVKAKENRDSKKMTAKVMNAFKYIFSTALLPEGSAHDGRRGAQYLYNKSVFNAALSIALCVGKNPNQFFSLIKRDKGSETYIWDYLIDATQKIHLPTELDQPLVNTQLDELREKAGYSSERGERNIAYMNSVALTGSSFTQLSLSGSILEASREEPDPAEATAVSKPTQDVDNEMTEASSEKKEEDEEENKFEIDVINSNSFMKPLTEFVKKINTLFPNDASWNGLLLQAFNASDEKINVQLHIAKVITNYPTAFEKYANVWLLPLITLATKGAQYGEPMNYLTRDICSVVNFWGKTAEIPLPSSYETRRILFEFVEFLIRNAYHDNRLILRSNIQLIKRVFENWGKYIPVPTRAIHEQLVHRGEDSSQNIVGIQVVSIVFLNGANPYDSNNEFTDLFDLPEAKFYMEIANNVNYKERRQKDIAADAAELMGMTMHYMREHDNPLLEPLKESFKTMLIDLSRSTKYTSLHFLKCMNRLYLRDTDLAKELVSIVTQNLSTYSSAEKLYALQFIAACWNDDDMIYYSLEQAGLERMISNRDENMQIATLKALNKIFEVLEKKEIKWIIKRITRAFMDHTNVQCRTLCYAFLKKAYETDHIQDEILKETIKAHLLKGLIDRDKTISQDIFAFIEKVFYVDRDINLTLKKITRELYMPDTEDIYLLYATCMILNNAKQSHFIEEPIFRDPLPNARFDADYHINTSWQNASSMMPLFRAIQEKTLNAEDLVLELRQTQSLLEFSATQGTNKSLLATFNPDNEGLVEDQSTIDNLPLLEPTNNAKVNTIKRDTVYKKRFIKQAKGASNRFHSDRNEKLEKKVRNLRNTYKEVSEKMVTLSRSYRAGELPDIQISFKDLLLPLEVLARADHNISRLLYSSLVVGIVTTNNGDGAYEKDIVKNIQRNIVDSTINFTPTVGSFLRVFLELNVTDLPERLIRNASSKSFNHHTGIALLERQLSITSVPVNAGKRRRADDQVIMPPQEQEKMKNRWIDLALLYKDIDEPEIFQNVYLTNVATDENVKMATNAEIRGDYVEAFNSFKRATDQFPDNTYEYGLWEEQKLYCYTQLTQWEDIANMVNNATNNDPMSSIWDTKTKDLYMDYFVRSCSKYAMKDYDNNQIGAFFDEAASNEAHREYLLKRYARDWTAVSIYRRQYDTGTQLIKNSYDSLLSAWTTLHPLAHTSRLSKLSQLERTVEIEDYLNLVKRVQQSVATSDKIENFFKALSLRYPDERSDSIDVWDEIIDSRSAFVDDITGQCSEIVNKELSLDRYSVKYLGAMREAAIKQNNLSILGKLTKKFRDLSVHHESKLTEIQYLQRKSVSVDVDKLRFLAPALARSFSYVQPHHSQDEEFFKSKLILAQSFDTIKQQLTLNPNLFDPLVQHKVVTKAFKNNPEIIADADTLINYLESVGFDRLKEAGEFVDKEDATYKEYLWKLGNYCDKSLRLMQDSNSTLQADIDPIQYSKLVIKYYFEAMGKGHKEAIENFPRLLELIELYPDCGPLFRDCSLELDETWRFIRWIPQLISFLETPIATYIFPALTRIAEDYPKALYYPFQMYFEHYELKKDRIPEEHRQAIEKIGRMIKSDIDEKFTFELKRLTNPDLIVKDFIDLVEAMLVDKEVPDAFVKSLYEDFRNLVLDPYTTDSGELHKKFIQVHQTQLSRLVGAKGSKLYKLTARDIRDMRRYYLDKIKDSASTKNTEQLKSYSNWLHGFKSSVEEDLEIPGQYDGLSKPYSEFHAKVANFDERVLCLQSIRKPKRLRINGTDEKEYYFLVKGGEDLRLDERVEQIFSVMNEMAKRNTFCSKQSIQLPTYKVIPMSLNLGLIEWVGSTRPLKGCIEGGFANKLIMGRLELKYYNWVRKHLKPNKKVNDRIKAYQDLFGYPGDYIAKGYEAIHDDVTVTALRDFLRTLASSPEAFLFLRKEFAYSVACISIFGYILGIGDRHLENALLDMKSGRLIPIDFGHAFGSATENLPIPELVPFRLTPQMVNVLSPLGVSGILENAMVNILKAIQDEKDLLLNIMNVFIKDPLLDWTKAATDMTKAQKHDGPDTPGNTGGNASGNAIGNTGQSTTSELGQIDWYPQKKLDIVKRKLNGENPADILVTQLTDGHASKPYYKDVVKLAKGDPELHIRAKVGATCKDTNEQVQCLIDLATDKAVLGTAWAGWQSYL